MKISIIVQYYNRRSQFLNTLNSIRATSISKEEIEVIIVDDASNEEHSINDVLSLYQDLNIKLYSFNKEDKWWSCPVLPINKGISLATGDILILLCAECMFIGDILLDIKNRIRPNDYLVYATLALPQEISSVISQLPYDYLKTNPFKGEWYQHSVEKNNCFNFCTAIMKEDMDRLGGFDERFAFGFDSGDIDFIWRVRKLGMNVISVDNPLTYHQWHPPHLFDEFSQRQIVSNLSGYALHDYIVNFESDNLKVKNSFIDNESFIPPQPELKPIKKMIDLDFEIDRKNGLFIDFACPYSNIVIECKITDLVNQTTEICTIRNNTWIHYQIFSDICEIEISFNGKVLFSNDVELGKYVKMTIKKQVDILTHF